MGAAELAFARVDAGDTDRKSDQGSQDERTWDALARIEELVEAMAEAEPDAPDLTPLLASLDDLHQQQDVSAGLTPVLEAIARLEAATRRLHDRVDGLHAELAEVQARVAAVTGDTDLTSVEEALARIEELAEVQAESLATVDVSPALDELRGALDQLGRQVPHRDEVEGQLGEILDALAAGAPAANMEDALGRIEDHLERASEHGQDGAVTERLDQVSGQLDVLRRRMPVRPRGGSELDPASIDALADAVAARLAGGGRSRSLRPQP